MGETPDNIGPAEATAAEAGPGHHQPKEVVWERWQKKRTFVRALEGTYGELQQGLMDQPRVYKSRDWQWKGGPQFFDKPIINPQRTDIAQSQQKSHNRATCRTTSTAGNVMPPGKLHKVPYDQEVAGIPLILNDTQLVFETFPVSICQLLAVAFMHQVIAELTQVVDV